MPAQGTELSNVPTWRTIELSFESTREYLNPYQAVDAEAVFLGPDGIRIVRPAFWDGGRTWKVRFAPTRQGRWRYSVTSTDATDTGLNGPSGEYDSSADVVGRPVHDRGFLKQGDGRYLSHADNTPFFWLGDTHWQFLAERWDEANKPGWDSQFRGMVNRRIDQGFTVYQSNLMMVDWSGGPSRYWLDGALFGEINVTFLQTVVDPRTQSARTRGLRSGPNSLPGVLRRPQRDTACGGRKPL